MCHVCINATHAPSFVSIYVSSYRLMLYSYRKVFCLTLKQLLHAKRKAFFIIKIYLFLMGEGVNCPKIGKLLFHVVQARSLPLNCQ